MTKSRKNTVSLNIKINEEISRKLEEQTIMEDRTKTAIVERALKDYFERRRKENNGT